MLFLWDLWHLIVEVDTIVLVAYCLLKRIPVQSKKWGWGSFYRLFMEKLFSNIVNLQSSNSDETNDTT